MVPTEFSGVSIRVQRKLVVFVSFKPIQRRQRLNVFLQIPESMLIYKTDDSHMGKIQWQVSTLTSLQHVTFSFAAPVGRANNHNTTPDSELATTP